MVTSNVTHVPSVDTTYAYLAKQGRSAAHAMERPLRYGLCSVVG